MLLVELDDYSKKIIGKPYSEEMLNEIAGLIEFLFQIATKGVGQDVPLEYCSGNIRIGVIIVGETSKILYDGIEPYLKAFTYKAKKKLESIYLLIMDKELLGAFDHDAYQLFVRETASLDKHIMARFQISKHFELKYTCTDIKGNRRKAKIIHYVPQAS